MGDIFDPQRTHPDIRYDLIPVTCVIDPLYISQGKVIWENNILLRSALQATYPDKPAFESAVRELIATMSENKAFIQYFSDTPPSAYKASDAELRTKNKAYIWEVPQEGAFYHRARVRRMASIPIFSPTTIQNRYSADQLRNRLKDNISIALQRLMQQLSDERDPQVNAIALASFGGSSRQQDSNLFLTFTESYVTIFETLGKSRPPARIDTVYLVVWKDLAQINALGDAIDGVYALYMRKLHSGSPGWLLPLPLLLVIAGSHWFTHPKRPNQLKYGNRREFITAFLGMVTLFAPSLYFIERPLFTALVERSAWLVVLSHCVLAYSAYRAFVWINRIKD